MIHMSTNYWGKPVRWDQLPPELRKQLSRDEKEQTRHGRKPKVIYTDALKPGQRLTVNRREVQSVTFTKVKKK